jgi:hypothetical protein
MAGENNKNVRLRTFCIENNETTHSHSGLLAMLSEKIKGSTAIDRQMRLNNEDIKRAEDLISDYNVNGQNFVSGVM